MCYDAPRREGERERERERGSECARVWARERAMKWDKKAARGVCLSVCQSVTVFTFVCQYSVRLLLYYCLSLFGEEREKERERPK